MKVAVVGSYGVGMTMNVARVPRSGETVNDGAFGLGPGGRGSNLAIGAARLGAEVSLLTSVGDDTFGAQARELWSTEGVQHAHVVTGDANTMVGFIVVESGGESRMMIAPGAMDRLTQEHVFDFGPQLQTADVAIVSLEIPLAAAIEALRIAHKSSTVTVLKPAPAHPLPPKVWGWIDILTPDLGEARVLAGMDQDSAAASDPGRVLDMLRGRFAGGGIVLTLTGGGAVVDDGEQRAEIPAVTPRRAVDAAGAGDAFTAALATAYGRGDTLMSAARYAAAARAWSVGVPDMVPSLPYAEDVDSLLSKDPEPT